MPTPRLTAIIVPVWLGPSAFSNCPSVAMVGQDARIDLLTDAETLLRYRLGTVRAAAQIVNDLLRPIN